MHGLTAATFIWLYPGQMTDTPFTTIRDDIDVLAPWGEAGPAPVGQWRTDILGDGFESRTLPLLDDEEGEVMATLVRHLPEKDPHYEGPARTPRFSVLYVHGRNDYFFQTELAQELSGAGGAFYALDLRKYGRSLRPHHTIGFIDDLRAYDDDISEALDVIHEDHPTLPLVLMGHSTGGLILTLWAYRHPGAYQGLILNSGWLEIQSNQSMRTTIQPVLERVAMYNPYWEVPMGGGPNFFARALIGGWAKSGFDLPAELAGNPDDPAIRGWKYAHEWKRPGSYPVPAAWMDAILEAHEIVEKEAFVDTPVLSMISTSTYFEETWDPRVFTSDVVLDVDVIVQRSSRLSSQVTIARFDGVHDLVLSAPAVRAQVFDTMKRWLAAFIVR